jgi:hypothetical protein
VYTLIQYASGGGLPILAAPTGPVRQITFVNGRVSAFEAVIVTERGILMSFLSKLFGAKFDDSQLISHATQGIAADPLIADATSLVVTSKKGVITLDGIVSRTQEKDRIEGAVRNALRSSGLKYESIVNDLKLGHH